MACYYYRDCLTYAEKVILTLLIEHSYNYCTSQPIRYLRGTKISRKIHGKIVIHIWGLHSQTPNKMAMQYVASPKICIGIVTLIITNAVF
jgi:hypothetical protein